MVRLWIIHASHKINYIICRGHTNKVAHHLRSVVWCGGDAQQLFSFSHSGVVDCLDVDVVTRHHDVTDLSVLLCICNLPNRHLKVNPKIDSYCRWAAWWYKKLSCYWSLHQHQLHRKSIICGCLIKGKCLGISTFGQVFSFCTRTGIMWLGQWTTGRPESISICRSSLTLLWCFLLSTWPSSLFRILRDSFAPASSMGGREVVKMKPAA